MSEHLTSDERAWREMDSAPRWTLIEGLSDDGEVDQVEWRDNRQCMLASVAPGAGECGPGWVSKLADYLPVDPPIKWRPL